MVQSKISKDKIINYTENKSVFKEDIDYETYGYRAELYGKHIQFVFPLTLV